MGYTHYWKMLKLAQPGEIAKALSLAKRICTLFQNTIQYEQDDNRPAQINDQGIIRFNGIDSGAHQTFYVKLDETINFAFCKTNRKQYDLPVCLCLLAIKDSIESFNISSDGGKQEWEPIVNYYRSNIGQFETYDPTSIWSKEQHL